MNEAAPSLNYKDRSLLLTTIGALLSLAGVTALLIGPVEIYSFYLFSEGGRFHYEGFGFGSFMFGNIACQVLVYYAAAAISLPLGYGHLKGRRWARTFSVTCLWVWLVLGAPLVVVFFLMTVTAKALPLAGVFIVAAALGLSYIAIPWLLLRFYQGHNVRLTFETRDPNSYWTEQLPTPISVLCILYLFYIVLLHVLFLFNGLFPLFGALRSSLQGFVLLDIAIVCLVCLLWGTFRQRVWAWWGALAYFGLITLSSILTLVNSTYADILSALNFPPRELEFLGGIPVQGAHFAILTGIPLLLTLGAIILSKRHFSTDGRFGRALHGKVRTTLPSMDT
jgi:hypothetical protein